MNILYNKIFKLFIIFSFFLIFAPVKGQANKSNDSTSIFRIGIELGGGYGYKLSTTNYLEGKYSRSGINGSLRFKWGSNNTIGAGLETGWLPISSLSSENLSTDLGYTNVEASLDAIPLLFIVAIQYFKFQIHAGVGYYNVISNSTVFDIAVESSEWDFGYSLSLGYAHPISSRIKFGTEIKWYNITEVQISILSIQARMMFILWEW